MNRILDSISAHSLGKLALYPSPKVATAGVLSVVTLLFGDLSEEIVMAILVLMLLDWLTGLMFAWKIRALNSKKALSGVVKCLIYTILLILAHQATHCGPSLALWLPQLIYAYVGITEIISVLENLYKISECYEIGDFGGLKIICNSLRGVMNRLLSAQSSQGGKRKR